VDISLFFNVVRVGGGHVKVLHDIQPENENLKQMNSLLSVRTSDLSNDTKKDHKIS
jgi:hypothetical protein